MLCRFGRLTQILRSPFSVSLVDCFATVSHSIPRLTNSRLVSLASPSSAAFLRDFHSSCDEFMTFTNPLFQPPPAADDWEETIPAERYVETWDRILDGLPGVDGWVVFRHGTVMVLADNEDHDDALLRSPSSLETPRRDAAWLRDEAISMMREYGPVYPGTSHGDFNVLFLQDDTGCVVTSHLDELMTFVFVEELDAFFDKRLFEEEEEEGDDGDSDEEPLTTIHIGMYGRMKRGLDAEELEVVHVKEVVC